MANAYATNAELKARFENDVAVSFLTDTGDTSIPDEAVLTEVIGNAEGMIDSYLSKRYSVPIAVADDAVVAGMLRSATLDLASYKLMKRGDFVPQEKRDDYDQTLEWLKDLASGKALLPSAATLASTSTDDPAASQGTASTGASSARIFNKSTLSQL